MKAYKVKYIRVQSGETILTEQLTWISLQITLAVHSFHIGLMAMLGYQVKASSAIEIKVSDNG